MTAKINTDLTVDAFVPVKQNWTWSQGPDPSTIQPVSLVGYTAQMMVRLTPNDASPLISISTTSTSSGQISFYVPTNGSTLNGIAILIETAAMSAANLVAGLQAFYDLLLFDTTGLPTKFAAGNFIVGPTYTH